MPDHFYVYPEYLDRGVSRRGGRRVAAAEGVEKVTIDAIAAAAVRLGLTAEAEPGKQFPRRAHAFAGRVKIAKAAGRPKGRLLHEIARAIREAPPPAPEE